MAWSSMTSCFQCALIAASKATKNVAKALRKICTDSVRAKDKTWFTELSDKGIFSLGIFTINGTFYYSARSTKVHLHVLVHS